MAFESSSMATSVVIGAVLSSGFLGATRTAERRAAQLGETWKETNAKLGATGGVVKYGALLKELQAKQQALGRSSTRLDRGIEEVQRRYRAAKAEVRSYGIEISSVAREHERLQAQLRRTERRQAALARQRGAGARLRSMRGRLAAGLGAAYGAARAIAPALGQERQGIDLGSVINADDRQAAVGRSVGEAARFSRRSLATRAEVLELEYQLNSASLDADASRAGAQLAHKLAIVTRGSGEEVAVVLGDVYNNLADGLEGGATERMTQIGNVLARAQLKFAISNFGQLGRGMRNAASSAAAYRVHLLDTAAAIGVLNTGAVKGERAGTAYSAVLRNMGNASKELGFDIRRRDDGSLDLIGTLERLEEALEGLNTDERANLLQKIFGDEGRVGLVPLLQNIDKLRKGRAALKADMQGGLVDEEYRRRLDAASGQVERMTQNFGDLGATIGSTLLQPLGRAASFIADATAAASEFIEERPALGRALGALAGGAGAGAAVIGAFTGAVWLWNSSLGLAARTVFGFAGRALGSLWGAARWAGGALFWLGRAAIPFVGAALRALGTAFMANPIGAAVTGIATAAWLIYEYWGLIAGFFEELWSGIESIFDGIDLGAAGRALIDTFVTGIEAVAALPGEAVRSVLEGVRDLLPFSDAREGPLSELTRSGRAIVETLGAGVRQAGGRPVRAALAGALAAGAVLPAALPAAPSAAAPVVITVTFEAGAVSVGDAGADLSALEARLEAAVEGALRRATERAVDGEYDEVF